MKFLYAVNWFDPQKQRSYRCPCQGSYNIALGVAKKKVASGMQQVVITVDKLSDEDDPDDSTWPPVEAEIGGM